MACGKKYWKILLGTFAPKVEYTTVFFGAGRVKVEQEYACARWMLAPNVLALNVWITWQVPQKNKGTNIEIYNPMDIEFEPH